MDFEQVLRTLLTEFERHQVRYAALGGFAMGVLGAARATMDLDLLIDREGLDTVHGIVTQLGYLRCAQTENVTHYQHPDRQWGGLDVIHAFRTLAQEMLTRAKAYPIFDGRLSIRVMEPEDVIGFKVQAIANNPKRRTQDEADIERLAGLYRDRLDWRRIQDYYELFEMGHEANTLRQRVDHAQ